MPATSRLCAVLCSDVFTVVGVFVSARLFWTSSEEKGKTSQNISGITPSVCVCVYVCMCCCWEWTVGVSLGVVHISRLLRTSGKERWKTFQTIMGVAPRVTIL